MGGKLEADINMSNHIEVYKFMVGCLFQNCQFPKNIWHTTSKHATKPSNEVFMK